MGLTVRDLLVREFGATFTTRIDRTASQVDATLALVLRQNPSRIGFTFVNVSPNQVQLSPTPNPSPIRRFFIEPNGGAMIAHWKEDGELVATAWEALAVAGVSAIYVLETVIERPTQEAEP